MTESLIVRTDASADIGTGHLMRCLALAEAWIETGGSVTFACALIPEKLRERLRARRIEVLEITEEPGSVGDADRTASYAQQVKAEWVVVDGYRFDAHYQRKIMDHGLRLLFVDDYGHADYYWADLVLNQNCQATPELYANRQPNTGLLLAESFVLLRSEFRRWRAWTRTVNSTASKILVTLGGSDPDNVSLQVLRAIEDCRCGGTETVIVAGPGNRYIESLDKAVRDSAANITLKINVEDMAALMAWADIAVAAAGTTCWELAFMQLPALLIAIADNQVAVAERAAEAGCGLDLGTRDKLSAGQLSRAIAGLLAGSSMRTGMASAGRRLVDGLGAARVVTRMQNRSIRLRPASIEDGELLFRWRCDPVVAQVSFSTGEPDWDGHVQWLGARLQDADCLLHIAESSDGRPIGQVRFDVEDCNADISISLDSALRGEGLGPEVIRLACERLFAERAVQVVYATIKSNNAASIRAFMRAGFVLEGDVTINEHPAQRYALRGETRV